MAGKKVTQMPVVTFLDGTEIVMVVQGGISKQTTVADIVAKYDNTKLVLNNDASTSYQFVLNDAGKTRRFTAATAVAITLPASAAVAFALGTVITLRQAGDGQITITPATGVVLNVPSGMSAKTRVKGSVLMLHKVGADEWDLTGDMLS